MGIPTAVFKYVEYELYSYDRTLCSIRELREEIIDAAPYLEVRVSGEGAGDITLAKVKRLVTDRVLARMNRVVEAVERALARLDGGYRRLFELKYRQGLDWVQVCERMPVSERTYYRMRWRLVSMVAFELGLIESSDDGRKTAGTGVLSVV